MTLAPINLLRQVWRDPTAIAAMSLTDWDLLIRQGRAADLLGQIAQACDAGCGFMNIPSQPRQHLQSAALLAQRQRRELVWEVEKIREALGAKGLPLVLLKGAAYAMSNSAAACGRLVSDVDILVRRDDLAAAESALLQRGWVSAAQNEYEQRYYRRWMHEIPPMKHFQRGTVIDVHHAILPLSGRLHPSTDRLLVAARPLADDPTVKVLSPLDLVLHSAAHLFHEGELGKGLRGLLDIDRLLMELGGPAQGWADLVARAHELELQRPLFYALRYAAILLGTPVPTAASEAMAAVPGARPSGVLLSLMDQLFLRALRPPHASTSDEFTPIARFLLYVRGHWLRMPPWLLTQHLTRKLLTPTKPPKPAQTPTATGAA